MSKVMHVERRGHVFEMRLDRPKANAIDAATSFEMSEVIAEFRDDPNMWVGILTGTGRFFSAGWDLKAVAAGEAGVEDDYGEGGFGGITTNFTLNKPLVAAVNGYAAGGGFELALGCDIIVASSEAKFMLSEVNIGLIADAGGVIRLPKRIPYGIAMEMLYTGRPMGAQEALDVGLICRMVEPDALMDTAREIADNITTSAPLAVQGVKSLLRDIDGLDVEAAFAAQAKNPHRIRALASEDAKEGPAAFAEKRTPKWTAK